MAFQSFNGKQYLQIDIANNFGLDKLDWDDRLTWFSDNENKLLSLLNQAKEPSLYYAGVRAWEKVKKKEIVNYPISLDATASGLQILSCLTGDISTARICNVVDTGHRRDAYTEYFNHMLTKVEDKSSINRDDLKSAVMTAFYGSTRRPKDIFGEGELLLKFLETANELTPGAWELNIAWLSLWNPTVKEYNWILPDNFHVKMEVLSKVKENVHFKNAPYEIIYTVNEPKKEGRSLSANTTHSVDGYIVKEIVRRASTSPELVKYIRGMHPLRRSSCSHMVQTLMNLHASTGMLSARILPYISPENISLIDKTALEELLESIPDKPFNILPTHDCFRVLPNYGNQIRKLYNTLLMEVARGNLLSHLIGSVTGVPTTVNKLDPEMYLLIKDSNYSLS